MRRPSRRLTQASLGLVLLAAACARADQTGYSGPYEAEVRDAIPDIEASMGLVFKAPPKVEQRTRDEVREFLQRQFTEQMTPLEMSGLQGTYRRLGMLPDTLDLRAFYLDLLTEQVAGYYDPATKVLYVVSGNPPDITGVTIKHELVHALQDQYVPLDSSRTLKGDNDRQIAMQAVMEGQAFYEQMAIMLGGDMSLRLPGGFDRIRAEIREARTSMPLFSNAPMVIQETLLFPYIAGAQFAREFKASRPGQAPYSPVASSSEQILHPEKYLAAEPDLPTRITLAAPAGASLLHEDNLGEFETRLFLHQHLNDAGVASRAAAGWDGDRYQLVQTPQGEGLAWFTVWDSAVEAAEFRDALQRAVERRFNVRTAVPGEGDSRSWFVGGRSIRIAPAEVAGRAAVIYEDVPATFRARLLPPARVSLQER